MKINRTFFDSEVRMDGDGEQQNIVGYAAVYNTFSRNLGGFIEVIRPGFFDNVLNDDVRSLWNHDPSFILGRTASGTLTISADERGLYSVTAPPSNSWGHDATVSIARGDVNQMSFAFSVQPGGDRWYERDEDGAMVRELLPGGCARLYDVSPVTYPAYESTEVGVRFEQLEVMVRQAELKPDEARQMIAELLNKIPAKSIDEMEMLGMQLDLAKVQI